ncbi:hypothetical protein ACH9L7_15930 [Haloferax sp. S1W]|uniref:hypothetical protein n=1 Tax=Haloferax sp. S1W TaxID=3377110 RepID=UPI0037CC1394
MKGDSLHRRGGVAWVALLVTGAIFAPVAGAAQTSVPAQAGATANTSAEAVERGVEQNSTTLSGAVTYQLSQADARDFLQTCQSRGEAADIKWAMTEERIAAENSYPSAGADTFTQRWTSR